MRKQITAIAVIAILTALLAGCGATTYQSITFTADVSLTGSFDFSVAGKTLEGADAAGTLHYTVSKAKTETASGPIDILNMSSTVATATNTLASSVAMYPSTLYPLTCEKSLTVKDQPSLNWTSKGVYGENEIAITIDTDNPDYEPTAEELKVPVSGNCYDNETLLLIARAADLALGASITIQTMNIQSGLSDTLVLSVASETETLKYNGTDYVCRVVALNSYGVFAKPSLQFWITDDVNGLPLKIVQSEITYTLTNYELG